MINDGNITSLKKYLERGGNPHTSDYIRNNYIRTYVLLSYAVSIDNIKIVELLLKNNINVNLKDDNGLAPIHYACETDGEEVNISILKLLIKHGANVNVKNNEGQTPIFSAIYMNKMDKVKLLIMKGANVNVENYEGITPLHEAVMDNDINVSIVKLLIQNGANLNATTKYAKKTPLHNILKYQKNQKKRSKLVKLLINHGAKLDVKNFKGDTPLHVSMDLDMIDIAYLLFKSGAKLPKLNINDRLYFSKRMKAFYDKGTKTNKFVKLKLLSSIVKNDLPNNIKKKIFNYI